MKRAAKSPRTSPNGRQKSPAAVRTRTAERVRRQERTITFLTQDELRQLFKVIRSKRDKAIFLVAYRHGLRASEIGLQVGFRRAEIAGLKVGDFHMNRGFDALKVVRKGGKKGSLAIHPQAAQRIRDYLVVALSQTACFLSTPG